MVNTRYLSPEDIEKTASDFIARYWQSRIIPVDISLIAERDLGFHIVPTDGLRDIGGGIFVVGFDG